MARTVNTLTGATTIRRAEITARGNYQTLERGHKHATRARDAAITRCNEEIECRTSAEELDYEQKLPNKGELGAAEARRPVQLAIPHDAKHSLYHVIVLLLCRVGNIRSAHVPKRADQTDEVLMQSLMPRCFPERAHENTSSIPVFVTELSGHKTGSRYDAQA